MTSRSSQTSVKSTGLASGYLELDDRDDKSDGERQEQREVKDGDDEPAELLIT